MLNTPYCLLCKTEKSKKYVGPLLTQSSVTSIGNYAFNSCIGLTEVTFPKKLTTIGYYVFSNCTGLKNITIPDSVTSIGSAMFSDCSNLTSVTIGNGLKEIPYEMFKYCKKLENVEINSNVTLIGIRAFNYCSNLESIALPDSVVEIGENAFSGCRNLEKVSLGSNITKIDSGAFDYSYVKCINISSIESWCKIKFVDESWSDYSYGHANPLWAGSLYLNGNKIVNLEIPNGITTINKLAFFNGSQFLSVSIPVTVTEIEKNAFSGCDNISTVYYGGTDTDWEEMYIDSGNDALTNATRKSIYYITLIDDDGNTSSITCLPNEKIKISDIEKKYMHKVTLYTDEKMTKEFDTTTAIINNMTLYVKLGEKITVIYGDIDDDGEITMNDAIYLFNAAMFPEQYSISAGQKTDYNGDSKFDMNDAIYLFNHAMFPEQYPI